MSDHFFIILLGRQKVPVDANENRFLQELIKESHIRDNFKA